MQERDGDLSEPRLSDGAGAAEADAAVRLGAPSGQRGGSAGGSSAPVGEPPAASWRAHRPPPLAPATAAEADDGPIRCVSPPPMRPMSSAGARSGRGSVAAAAPLAAAAPRGGNPLLRASANIGMPGDFPAVPPPAVRRSIAASWFVSEAGAAGAAAAAASPPPTPDGGGPDGDDEASSEDGDVSGGDVAKPLLPLAAFGPRPLSRDPDMEAKLAAQRAAEAQLGALDAALIARLSGPLRRVTLRPASALPATSASAWAGGAAVPSASLWGWGGTAEGESSGGVGGEDEEDDDDDDGERDAFGISSVSSFATTSELRRSRSHDMSAAVARAEPGATLTHARPARHATFPRDVASHAHASWEGDAEADAAAPAPATSPSFTQRRAGGGGGMARAGERVAAARAAAAAAATAAAAAAPAASPLQPVRGGGGARATATAFGARDVAQRPATAAAAGQRARTADVASPLPPLPRASPGGQSELDSFLARQEAFTRMYRERAAAKAAEAAAAAAAAAPPVNAVSRRLAEQRHLPSLRDRLSSPPQQPPARNSGSRGDE